jgi:acetyltransferase-like isoleucine patch superfamily enzyme
MRSLFARAKSRAVRWLHAPIVDVQELRLGREVRIEPNVEIHCRRLVLGDGVVIRAGTRIEMTDLVIGDYTVINQHCFLSGTNWCRIGHNSWIGHYSVVDSIGTTRIGDNVGVGAHSQLWTHAYFGDILEGCNFASERPLVIEDDVWLVGHCIVTPIHAASRSMAMVGSVVTRDMEANRVYAGVPAKDMTDRFGPQFSARPAAERRAMLERHLEMFYQRVRPRQRRLEIVDHFDPSRPDISQFSLGERRYLKHLYPEEVAFMHFLLPTKAKFLPDPSSDWVAEHLAPGSQAGGPPVHPDQSASASGGAGLGA